MFQKKEVGMFVKIYVANIKFFKVVLFCDVFNIHDIYIYIFLSYPNSL